MISADDFPKRVYRVEISRSLSLFPLFLSFSVFSISFSHPRCASPEEEHYNVCPFVKPTRSPRAYFRSLAYREGNGVSFRAIRGRTGRTVSLCLIPRLRRETAVSNVGARRWDLREVFLPRFIRRERHSIARTASLREFIVSLGKFDRD